MRTIVVALVLALTVVGRPSPSVAQPAARATPINHELQWYADLESRMIVDISVGLPIVANIIAPLCDTTILACGNAKLGDGDSLRTNLYWATTAGFGEWFGRRRGGWRNMQILKGEATGDKDLLATLVYARTITTPAAWQKRGAPKTYELMVVVNGWRGKAIDRALHAYAREVSGLDSRTIELLDQRTIATGGAAHMVAYSGHNRLMDVETFTWPVPAPKTIGAIAVGCLTADYMETSVPAATRVPLLMTRDFMFANAAPVEATILAVARGQGYAAIRRDAATAYAAVQETSAKRVFGAFTNPADRRWQAAP